MPKKDCTAIDFLTNFNLLIAGYNDGYVRYYDYVNYEIIGQIYIG